MYNPELEGQLNALPLPYRARHVVIKDAQELLANLPQLVAYRQQKERVVQEVASNISPLQPTPETFNNERMQNTGDIFILDDHRDRSVASARDAIEAIFDAPEDGYVQEAA